MQAQYLQNLRYKLQRRIRRLNASEGQTFYFRLKEFLAFFDGQPILVALAAELVAKCPDCSASVERIFSHELLFGETEIESAAIGYSVLRRYGAGSDPNAHLALIDITNSNSDGWLEQFRTLYLEPFYEYIDEHLDDRSFVLQTLLRYKHACEWFRRSRLYTLWQEDTRRGERLLALDLYEYLHERGIDFHIEPWSASGEADMVSLQQSNDPLIADAKIFNPEGGKPKSYILRGFHQLYQYTCDYNQSIGYLVIQHEPDALALRVRIRRRIRAPRHPQSQDNLCDRYRSFPPHRARKPPQGGRTSHHHASGLRERRLHQDALTPSDRSRGSFCFAPTAA
jgi:hypothetical protein